MHEQLIDKNILGWEDGENRPPFPLVAFHHIVFSGGKVRGGGFYDDKNKARQARVDIAHNLALQEISAGRTFAFASSQFYENSALAYLQEFASGREGDVYEVKRVDKIVRHIHDKTDGFHGSIDLTTQYVNGSSTMTKLEPRRR